MNVKKQRTKSMRGDFLLKWNGDVHLTIPNHIVDVFKTLILQYLMRRKLEIFRIMGETQFSQKESFCVYFRLKDRKRSLKGKNVTQRAVELEKQPRREMWH